MFQSAPPSRAAAGQLWHLSLPLPVSIRAALTGGGWEKAGIIRLVDVSIRAALTGGGAADLANADSSNSFNPRRPHGRRPRVNQVLFSEDLFQSAPPSRAAAETNSILGVMSPVSIRAALTGGGGGGSQADVWRRGFNPRRPHGRRQGVQQVHGAGARFQSAPPSRAAALVNLAESHLSAVSIRAALTGGGRSDDRR